ncbi:related to WD40-repeat protein (notchless protein) [Serendipita indica DSM 11827]|uniref:Related to WD40-repeat protein (Notchless protein) n=1 Tax=Serendipita indica (strain DSM 11827) TaxID=1109443 RepID=G4TY14_SERID|nr:related to WD40-repeat protein (notchless protein) [Serendipita indica DSM 11827]
MSAKRRDKSKKSHETVNPPESSSVAQSSSSRKNQVYDTVNFGLDALGNISEGSDVLAPLKAACRTTKSVLDIMQAIESNQEEWTNLTQRLKEYMSGLEKQTTLFEAYAANDRAFDEALRQPLMHYFEYVIIPRFLQQADRYRALKDIHDTVVEVREKRSRSKLGFLKSMSKVKIDAGEIRELNRDIEDGHRQFMVRVSSVFFAISLYTQEALGIFTALRTQAIERRIETATILQSILQLPTVAFAASSVHTTCLKGTREAVLQMIWRWASEVPSEKPIFWLCDIAGSGKSTVAMSVVESWRNEGVLGGRFFFSMANNDASTTDKFCSTIARDLVHYFPDLRPHIAKAVEQNPSFMRNTGLALGEPLRGHKADILAIRFSPDGSKIVSASCDNMIQLWDAATGESLGEPVRGPEEQVAAIAISPNGSQTVTGSRILRGPETLSQKTIRLWETNTGQPLGEPLQGHEAPVAAVRFSPDSSRIVSGSHDGTIRLWYAGTGHPMGKPFGGHGFISTVGFSPDGSQIASSSYDNSIRLWDANTGQPLGEPLRGHQSMIRAVEFSPDGSRIVSSSLDKTIRLWNAEIDTRAKNSDINETEGSATSLKGELGSHLLGNLVPGFEHCSLSWDGWVQSSGKYLFWVPPDNRHGLQYPRLLLTIPTTSPFRATKVDFSRFHCGPSWTSVRTDLDQ